MTSFSRILLFVLFLSAPSIARECRVIFISEDKQNVELKAEIAETPDQRTLGLMYRKNLPENSGMLFIFEKEEYLSFWMKNTFIPLDIAYIGSNRIINEIYEMKPLDTSVSYPSRFPARYVIEVNKGYFLKKGIYPGSKVIIDGCIGK